MGEWTLANSYFLVLMTSAYIVGEIAHFLINTTAREVAQDVHFGDKSCFFNESFTNSDSLNCSTIKEQIECSRLNGCSWQYSGMGIKYQILAGPAFVAVFSISGVLISVFSDKMKGSVSKAKLLAGGTALFSTACLLMAFSESYWQLVILRMLIAAGESVCRPMSGAIIADLFSAQSRGLANGLFSWGVYIGFGLAFVLGINGTKADILGYGWRATYVLAASPGLIIAGLIMFTLHDPPLVENAQNSSDQRSLLNKLCSSFANPSLLLLLIAAIARHTAGLSWAYNTRLFFQYYHQDFDLGYWILLASVVGGSFGVFAGGYFSDRLVRRMGLPSRLWLLSFCTLVASPLAAGVLYFDPPGAMGYLIGYYLLAETWFAVLFTVIVEVVSPEVRATCIALFLFFMNQVGGNLPVVISPLKNELDDYRMALTILWPGAMALSSILFCVSSFPLYFIQRKQLQRAALEERRQQEIAERTPSPDSQEFDDKSPTDSCTKPLLT